MQVASRDRRILMAGDPLQDVQIDTGVGHPYRSGMTPPVADQPWLPESMANMGRLLDEDY